ncbi:MAG TPA: TadA family conjugal transfer-associated ATPase [Ornithinimicrobium sp.]|uniref:TadA family conjugal transfer-associated ATPase n=1 Tax=Ornithinimicrobium sp. TaxID=1977084 RepID=UPI002B485437|nr:TadA family conjugal transfer-associated ATPase [Ornithinimicrobium sp.]HKJ12369.1 TadA family conjugal transfer-associated ATPase [Ornithinimicrobium sp.]
MSGTFAEGLGLGPLSPLVFQDGVTDVLVNGSAGVWVDRGNGLHRADLELHDDSSLRRLAVRLAAVAGQRLDSAAPYVDGLLPGGIRLHAVLPPLVDGAAHISLRIPRRVPPSLATLRELGMFDRDTETVLRRIVRARVAFLVGGGTGSGKTTLLAALLSQVPARERIVVVEDVRELSVDHPHVVYLQGRAANVEGRGEITLTTLVRQSLRMRPDRVVLGEARGAEVRELLTALNTGHEGGCGTVHTNSAADVVPRLEALGGLAGLGPEAVRTQLGSAIQVVLHVERVGPVRRLTDIAVIGLREGRLRVRSALRVQSEGWVVGQASETLERLLDRAGER